MKFRIFIQFLLSLVFVTSTAIAQEKKNPECDKPLSENSPIDVVCNPNDKNLREKRPVTNAGSPEQEKPGTCDKCEEEKNRTVGRMKDNTTFRPSGSSGTPSSSGQKTDGQQ